jgi:hypothetical protein
MPVEISKFFQQIVQDEDGVYSSKRVIIFIAFFLLCLAFVSNLFWGFVVATTMFDGMMYIVLAGMGFATVGEKVMNFRKPAAPAKVE